MKQIVINLLAYVLVSSTNVGFATERRQEINKKSVTQFIKT